MKGNSKAAQICICVLTILKTNAAFKYQGSLDHGRTADGGRWLASRSVLFYLREKNPSLTIWLRSWSGRGGEEINPFQYFVSHYTPKNSHICISARSICLCYFKDPTSLHSVYTSFKIKVINSS
jgi:hypothetical protein